MFLTYFALYFIFHLQEAKVVKTGVTKVCSTVFSTFKLRTKQIPNELLENHNGGILETFSRAVMIELTSDRQIFIHLLHSRHLLVQIHLFFIYLFVLYLFSNTNIKSKYLYLDSSIVIWVTRVYADIASAFRSVPYFNEFCKFWKRS